MKNQYDALRESQEKIMDFWTNAGKAMMDNWTNASTGLETPQDFLQVWLDNSKKLWYETSKTGDMSSAFNQNPELLKHWIGLQQQFAKNWLKFYQQQTKTGSLSANGGYPGFGKELPSNPLQYLQEWMKQSQDWAENLVLENLPAGQQSHLKQFKDIYQQMFNYWEPLLKVIKLDLEDWNQINHLFSQQKYLELVGQFMGFQAPVNPEVMQQELQKAYDRFAEWTKGYTASKIDWTDQVKKFNEVFSNAEGSPVKYVYDMNRLIGESLDSYLSISGQGKEIEMIKIMKEIQFAYFAFIAKSTEMQQKVYEASAKALPESIAHFSQQYEENKTLPDYQNYFKYFVDTLEKHVTSTFASDEYSQLQSLVAKNASTVKSLSEKLVELASSDLPFLTNSFADEVALENKTLRKKLRDLELRIEQLENRDKPESSGINKTKKKVAVNRPARKPVPKKRPQPKSAATLS
ncbi:MAG: hypothetical protein HKN76_06890 [Saprospiraceae bacterium]|nr:hypothetical protein [Saprospiraceae bacterium]